MTLAGIVPGPQEPRGLDSFLLPLVEKFLALAEGVPAYNCLRQQTFNMKAWIIMVHADMPAMAKAMSATGTGRLHSCRFCHICGIYHSERRHYYYPTVNPGAYPTGYRGPLRPADRK
jgi:hypothetical protein